MKRPQGNLLQKCKFKKQWHSITQTLKARIINLFQTDCPKYGWGWRATGTHTYCWLDCKMVIGLHPTGLQALYLPSFKIRERAWSWRWQKHHWFNPGVPNLFDNRDQFCGIFFHELRGRGIVLGWSKCMTFIMHFISIIYLLLLYQLHFRSSSIVTRSLGTPGFMDRGSYLHFWSKVLEQHPTVCDWWAEHGGTSHSRGRGGYHLWRH